MVKAKDTVNFFSFSPFFVRLHGQDKKNENKLSFTLCP